jgi:molybdopterin/thiamine biosynthesis adenylyltransferase
MTAEICICAADLTSLREAFFPSPEERCAVLFASESLRGGGEIRLLVRRIKYPESADYSRQGIDNAELTPSFVARVAKEALSGAFSLIFVHTHPGDERPSFSSVDDQGEQVLATFLRVRGLSGTNAALVMSNGGLRGRLLGLETEMRVISVGAKREVEFDPELDDLEYSPVFDRQVRAFGAAGQRQLERLEVAIVGLGGTGSIAAQQLVHLGVRRFVLIDPDDLEEPNLNRVVGATRSDVGQSKISVAARYLQGFDPDVTIVAAAGDVVRDRVARELINADFILCCTDSHGSRAVVQQIAYQYLIPCIDMGSIITQETGRVTGIFGRVQLLAPGLPCLWCSGLLDAAEIRRDMMNESERRLDPYIVDGAEPAPSVISLNGTVVSLAVSMLIGVVTGVPIDATHVIYNASSSTLRPVRGNQNPDCFICSPNGLLACGDGRPLYTRQD